MRPNFFLILLQACVVLAPSWMLAGGQKLRVSKGAIFSYNMKNETSNSTTMMGQESVSTLVSTMKGLVNVASANADSVRVDLSMRDASISVKGMSMFRIPDTTFKKDDFAEGKETVVLNSSGNVLRRETKTATSGIDRDQMVTRQLVGSRNLMRGLFIGFPDKSFTQGDVWSVPNSDTSDIGSGKIISNSVMRYTFEGSIDTLGMKCATITAKSERFVISGTMKQMGREMSLEGDGVVNTRYIFEVATGMPVVVVSHTQSDQRISLGEGLEIPTSMDIRTTLVRAMK